MEKNIGNREELFEEILSFFSTESMPGEYRRILVDKVFPVVKIIKIFQEDFQKVRFGGIKKAMVICFQNKVMTVSKPLFKTGLEVMFFDDDSERLVESLIEVAEGTYRVEEERFDKFSHVKTGRRKLALDQMDGDFGDRDYE